MTDAASRSSPARAADDPYVSIDTDALRLPAEWEAVLDVLIDDQRVWSFTPSTRQAGENGIRRVPWPPPLRAYLDGAARVKVREHLSNRVVLDRECQFGTGRGRVRVVDWADWPLALDKGGRLQRCFDSGSPAMIDALLDNVEQLLGVLRHDCGLPAFLSFGALLGAIREGALLGHDSDADVSYLSAREHPLDVARESYRVERVFRRKGFTVRRFSAADFKVQFTDLDGATRGIDIFAGFMVEDVFHLMPTVRAKLPRSAILPLGEVELEGRSFPAPADPAALLAATYGEGWRVPDPSFKFHPPRATTRRLGGWMRGLNVHRPYWDNFYREAASAAVPAEPSAFARWVGEREGHADSLMDVGCGTGRDALWFAEGGHQVLGLDYSKPAVKQCVAAADACSLPASFEIFDLYDLRYVLSMGARLGRGRQPVVLYARFLVHALDDVGRHHLWRLADMALRTGGRLYLEFRTGTDAELCHEFGEHFRRPLDPDVVVDEIAARGGQVEYREEGHGLAVYRDEDPHICRMVVRWTR